METILLSLLFIGIVYALIVYIRKKEKGSLYDNYDWTSIEIKGLRYDKSRIEAAKKLKFNEIVNLIPDNNNSHDEFAVMVQNSSGMLIGYIPMTLSRITRNMIKDGEVLKVYATDKSLSGNYPSINIQIKLPKGWFKTNDDLGDTIIDFNGSKKRIV